MPGSRSSWGSGLGSTGAPAAPTPLVGAEVVLPAGLRWRVPTDPAFEAGVLVDRGEVTVEGVPAERSQLVALPVGREALTVEAGPDGARVLVLAGEPFPSPVVMWWNFVGRDHDGVVAAREEGMRQVEQHRSAGSADGRFGAFPPQWDEVLPAPDLPTVRLKARSRT